MTCVLYQRIYFDRHLVCLSCVCTLVSIWATLSLVLSVANSYWCEGVVCCKDTNSCCGDRCCAKETPCCKHGGSSTCCNDIDKACCEGNVCVDPCESQLDVIGCQLSRMFLDPSNAQQLEEPSGPSWAIRPIGDNLYQILRPNEKPQGISAVSLFCKSALSEL